MQEPRSPFDLSAAEVIEAGNRMLDQDESADAWEVASGLLAGAIQFWLFSRQPCDDPFCESCAELATAERRITAMLNEARQLAEDSDYYQTPNDSNVGTA
ncbi:MAG: hypothetical protein JJT85_00250 [Chromatiales bacterium]|nr:hypothetical protein [Chromatiales bacterium]